MQAPPVQSPPPSSPFDMEAKKKLQKSANWKVGGGFLGSFSMGIFSTIPGEEAVVMAGVMILSFAFSGLLVWGCCDYARSKGYTWTYGLLGLLGCIGLIVLVVLPDKWKPTDPQTQWPTNYPRQPGA